MPTEALTSEAKGHIVASQLLVLLNLICDMISEGFIQSVIWSARFKNYDRLKYIMVPHAYTEGGQLILGLV